MFWGWASWTVLVSLLSLFASNWQRQGGGTENHSSLAFTGQRAPIIIVPGLGASKLEIKLNRENIISWNCDKEKDWSLTWINFNDIRRLKCFCDQLRLLQVKEDGEGGRVRYHNQEGVEIRPYDFGGVQGISKMIMVGKKSFDKMSVLVRGLQDAGWEPGKTMFGAPYDWRYGPRELTELNYYQNLTHLIEKSVELTGQPAVVVGHSLGSLTSAYFLARMSEPWKRKHIRKFISISAPFGGAVRSLKGLILGDSGDFPFIRNHFFYPIQKNCISALWLLPREDLWEEDVLQTPSRNYSASDVNEILTSAGLTTQASLQRNIKDERLFSMPALGVPTQCLYSTNVKTISKIVLNAELNSANTTGKMPSHTLIYDKDGDGLVNLRSLRKCDQMADEVKEFDGVDHRGMLAKREVIDIILDAARVRS